MSASEGLGLLATASQSAEQQITQLLGWLRRLLAWQVEVTRQTFGALAADEYRGLYVPDAELPLLYAELPPLSPALRERRQALASERAELAQQADAELPLLRIGRLCGLNAFERDLLLLALAPELDLRFERLFGYIQDDVTKKRPSVDLALRLLCPTPAAMLAARGSFAATAPLLRWQLIQLFEDGQRNAPLPARFIKLDERIAAELLGQPVLDPQLTQLLSALPTRRTLDDLLLPDNLRSQLRRMVGQPDGALLLLQGGYGSGRRAIAEALSSEAQRPLLAVALRQLSDGDGAPERLQRVLREALLRRADLLWLDAEPLLGEDSPQLVRQALLEALEQAPGQNYLVLSRNWEPRGSLRRRALRIELPDLNYSEREQLWRRRLNGSSPDQPALRALASTFRLSGGQIRDAAAMARTLASWQGLGETPGIGELYAACRAQSSGKLDSLAHKIRVSYSWDDIVLPAEQVGQLREICIQVRHRRTVLESWGFDKHLAMGKGVNVLFAGQSGTGKTMAADIIAADLGLELYKVDLSSLVSKYIGETEKNLERIFQAAREANAILFFDEADALFGKRSEVKDAHDRYANIEVGYLLQKMEEYDGVVILATNLRKNLDDAFVRRLHVAIDFPFPEEPDRLRIWRKVFPPAAPLATDIDLGFLARQFKLAGGNIRNIALLAAYLAAEDGTQIGMAQIIRAIRREYQKLGKLVTEAEFGSYLAQTRR